MVVEFNGKKVYFNGEINDTFDVHGPYCKEVEALGTDDDGNEYSAIGISDGTDITEIEEDTIECIGYDEKEDMPGFEGTWEELESLVDNNPDDGSWVGR